MTTISFKYYTPLINRLVYNVFLLHKEEALSGFPLYYNYNFTFNGLRFEVSSHFL
jgi:hypothetical protein